MSRVNCLCLVLLPELGIVPRYFEQLFDSPLVQMGIKVIFNPGLLFGISRYLLMNPLLLVPDHLHKPLQQEKPSGRFRLLSLSASHGAHRGVSANKLGYSAEPS